jgi:hypothetical protein
MRRSSSGLDARITSTCARELAELVAPLLGQAVIVVNKPTRSRASRR